MIATFSDPDIFKKSVPSPEDFKLRRSVKGVIQDDLGRVAFVHFEDLGCHIMPGGELELNETYREALQRETLEETGLEIIVGKKIGKVIDYKFLLKQKNITHAYFAKTTGKRVPVKLTKTEKSHGKVSTHWFNSLDAAIQALKADEYDEYIWQFIKNTEILILTEAQKLLHD